MTKTLIAFFSRADENYFSGAMRYVKVGNTEIVCNLIREMIPADSFKIEMKNPYSPVYMTCIEEAKKDLREKARPELASYPESLKEYDTVILAYPNYWGTMPMAVVTFLEKYDFTGKTILPLHFPDYGAALQIAVNIPGFDSLPDHIQRAGGSKHAAVFLLYFGG